MFESLLVEVPTVIGWLRPMILLPASALVGLSPQQLESLLVHELAHIRRHNYLVNLVQTTVETLLFYHPAVWWVSQQVREEREDCCDDLAVAVCGDVLVYARALAELEQLRAVGPHLAVAANGGHLLRRIQRLIGSPAPISRGLTSWIGGLFAVGTVFALLATAHTNVLPGKTISQESSSTSSIQKEAAATNRIPQAHTNEVAANKKKTEEATKSLQDQSETVPSVNSESIETAVTSEPAAQDKGSEHHGDFIDELAAAGYTNLTVDELIALKTHNVNPEFIKEMNQANGAKLSVRELINLRNVGISSKYIHDMRDLGYDKLTIRELMSMSVQGVNPEFIHKLNDAGYSKLSSRELISMSIQGVTPSYIKEMKDLGYDHLPVQDLIRMSIHGITASYAKQMKDAGFKNLTPSEMTNMSIQGVTPEFVREFQAMGFKELSPEELTSMSIQGVTPKYVKSMRDAGYTNLSPREYIRLRIHGVTPDFIKKAASHGFKDLSVDQLIKLSQADIF